MPRGRPPTRCLLGRRRLHGLSQDGGLLVFGVRERERLLLVAELLDEVGCDLVGLLNLLAVFVQLGELVEDRLHHARGRSQEADGASAHSLSLRDHFALLPGLLRKSFGPFNLGFLGLYPFEHESASVVFALGTDRHGVHAEKSAAKLVPAPGEFLAGFRLEGATYAFLSGRPERAEQLLSGHFAGTRRSFGLTAVGRVNQCLRPGSGDAESLTDIMQPAPKAGEP